MRDTCSTDLYLYRLLKIKMVTYNDIKNLLFVIVNNISYNKIEVEKIVDGYLIHR